MAIQMVIGPRAIQNTWPLVSISNISRDINSWKICFCDWAFWNILITRTIVHVMIRKGTSANGNFKFSMEKESSLQSMKVHGDVEVRILICRQGTEVVYLALHSAVFTSWKVPVSFYRRLNEPQDRAGHRAVNENLNLFLRDRTRGLQTVSKRPTAWALNQLTN